MQLDNHIFPIVKQCISYIDSAIEVKLIAAFHTFIKHGFSFICAPQLSRVKVQFVTPTIIGAVHFDLMIGLLWHIVYSVHAYPHYLCCVSTIFPLHSI